MIARGFANQCTDYARLDSTLLQSEVGAGPMLSAYIGFDATARSLHVGNLIQLMMLRRLQRCGHRPILLLGGGTTLVGDPSGRDKSREMLSEDVIERNAVSLAQVFGRYVELSGTVVGAFSNGRGDAHGADDSTAALIVNNAEWLRELELLPFLRDVGAHFSMSRLLGFESARRRLRLEQPFSVLEFSYVLLQAYDFVELNRRHRVSLQLGGSDQWGNIVAGVELGKRLLKPGSGGDNDGRESGSARDVPGAATDGDGRAEMLYGLTAPLLTTADGRKMGKSVGGAGTVWLDPEQTSPYDYWQWWRNVADEDVARMLRLFTDLPPEEINELLGASRNGAVIQTDVERLNVAKEVLADEATTMLHGQDEARKAREAARSVFSGTANGALLDNATRASLPHLELQLERWDSDGSGGPLVADLLVETGLAASKKAARRLLAGNGVRLDGETITSEWARMTSAGFEAGMERVLSAGKKKHAILRAGNCMLKPPGSSNHGPT
eukprot:g1752.t1